MSLRIEDVESLTDEDYERGRKAVEDVLIEFRDSRISLPLRNNGLCVKERDGTPSNVIRLAIEDALRIGMRAIAEAKP